MNSDISTRFYAAHIWVVTSRCDETAKATNVFYRMSPRIKDISQAESVEPV